MSAHEIKLPPLPDYSFDDGAEIDRVMLAYATAAIELDRHGRGVPVAWIKYSDGWCRLGEQEVSIRDTFFDLEYAKRHVKHDTEQRGLTVRLVPVFEHPQPANPTIKESLTAAEPVKEVSDDAKEFISLVDTLIASVNEAHHANRDDWRDACFQAADQAYETIKAKLLATYSQPAQPSVDQYGVVVCDKRVPNAMQTFVPQRFYADSRWQDERFSKVPVYTAPVAAQPSVPEGWMLVPFKATRAMQDAWDTAPSSEDCDEEFHGAYNAMLAAAPTPPADGQAQQEVSAGLEIAAAWLEKRASNYDDEHGSTDPDTGTREYPGDGSDYYNELMENAESIRALKASYGSEIVVGDLAMLVKQLVRALGKASPASDLPKMAMDYLARKGLQGSPLRSAQQEPQS